MSWFILRVLMSKPMAFTLVANAFAKGSSAEFDFSSNSKLSRLGRTGFNVEYI
jgi:hypothetical protein